MDPKTCEMTRGFQVCPQDSNRIGFDPIFDQELPKIGKIPVLAYFRPFFGQKWGKMLLDLSFEAKFGILSSFCISRAPFDMIFTL